MNSNGFDEQTSAAAARNPRYTCELHGSNHSPVPVDDEKQFVGGDGDDLVKCGHVRGRIGFRGDIASRRTDGIVRQKLHK